MRGRERERERERSGDIPSLPKDVYNVRVMQNLGICT